ncbi:flavin reductase family protein [Flavihumibacter profundi]|uniref:flavin reductase family protein n=1 Tax=Flavihumibacter profundi TaxID=2716883 RepID=UPI001CC57866|nr:flavin reductase family protein [Flavihumibacter profundi]MBZ5856817.1 flavin reductase family protein [Flavihumibacter profundi]
MRRKSFPLSKVYGLLEPGPVVLLTTARQGENNVMTMSWLTMMEFEPPLIGCVVSNQDYSFDILKATRECVIAIPTAEIAAKVVQVGNTSGRDIDKFKSFDLTAEPASVVKAPLIKECYANFECKVIDTTMVNKYNFFVLEVVKAWINPAVKEPKTIHHMGKGVFMVAGEKIKLPSKMK